MNENKIYTVDQLNQMMLRDDLTDWELVDACSFIDINYHEPVCEPPIGFLEECRKRWEALKKDTQAATSVAMTAHEIESMGKKNPITGNVTLSADECRTLKDYAVSSFAEKAEKIKYKQKFEQAEKSAKTWKQRYDVLHEQYQELKKKAQPFLDALEIASEKVRAFLNAILARGQEKQGHKAPARKRGQDIEH